MVPIRLLQPGMNNILGEALSTCVTLDHASRQQIQSKFKMLKVFVHVTHWNPSKHSKRSEGGCRDLIKHTVTFII